MLAIEFLLGVRNVLLLYLPFIYLVFMCPQKHMNIIEENIGKLQDTAERGFQVCAEWHCFLHSTYIIPYSKSMQDWIQKVNLHYDESLFCN
jgi:hypothetical protein